MELDHRSLASIVLLEVHRYIDEAADRAIQALERLPPTRTPTKPGDKFARIHEMREGTTLAYPPNDEARLTDEELRALVRLQLPPAARSGLRKVLRAAASAPLFQLFCLLDAVGDPALTSVDLWLPVNLSRRKEGDSREMMHDEFTDSFWKYHEGVGERG
jgi:hypothetical protein